MRLTMRIFVLICVLFSSFSLAQGESAIPFLIMPTNAEMNGMGNASVAHITNNPAALISNPAQLGIQCLDNKIIAISENYGVLLPSFHLSNWSNTTIVNAGTNLNNIFPNLPQMSIGISLSNIYLNYQELLHVGPDFIGSPLIHTHDQSNQITLSIAADYFVRASIGFSFKHIDSDLGNFPTAQKPFSGYASGNLFDFGFLVDVPFITLISQLENRPAPVFYNLSPLFNFSLGISENNYGQEYILNTDRFQGAPLPRFTRAGIELNLGLKYNKNNISWIPFSFKWTIEANDLLVKTDNLGNNTYQSGLGDINFFREVILGKTNKETEKLKGWEINLGEFIYIYGGRLIEDPVLGNHNFTSGGYAINLSGLFKTLVVIGQVPSEGNFMHYFLHNFGLKFNQSSINTIDINSPLNKTQFYSLNISFYNWL